MGATLDIDSSTDQFERHCFKYFSSSTVDVCFTKRDESATSSDFSVADMEVTTHTLWLSFPCARAHAHVRSRFNPLAHADPRRRK